MKYPKGPPRRAFLLGKRPASAGLSFSGVPGREGIPSGIFYVVKQGQALVVMRNAGAEDNGGKLRVIAELGPGEFFGELELLRGTPPIASVAARTALTVVALPHADIRTLVLGDDTIARDLEQIGTGRLYALGQVS